MVYVSGSQPFCTSGPVNNTENFYGPVVYNRNECNRLSQSFCWPTLLYA